MKIKYTLFILSIFLLNLINLKSQIQVKYKENENVKIISGIPTNYSNETVNLIDSKNVLHKINRLDIIENIDLNSEIFLNDNQKFVGHIVEKIDEIYMVKIDNKIQKIEIKEIKFLYYKDHLAQNKFNEINTDKVFDSEFLLGLTGSFPFKVNLLVGTTINDKIGVRFIGGYWVSTFPTYSEESYGLEFQSFYNIQKSTNISQNLSIGLGYYTTEMSSIYNWSYMSLNYDFNYKGIFIMTGLGFSITKSDVPSPIAQIHVGYIYNFK